RSAAPARWGRPARRARAAGSPGCAQHPGERALAGAALWLPGVVVAPAGALVALVDIGAWLWLAGFGWLALACAALTWLPLYCWPVRRLADPAALPAADG
ncbi:hypothetical protein, partial [Micromonospora globispora]|uniref:hypothetical protein n=1 Tax=Micromonospora globispora TaxID=1450148 RepID=UPI001C8AB7B7